jgi:cytochrome c peroxidase
VLDHYVNQIKTSTTLDPSLIQGIALSNAERLAIVAFLQTLTDEKFIQNEKFSNPF